MTGSAQTSRRIPTAELAFLGLFAALVALLGGSSRPDAIQIVALRPLAALFLIPALYLLTREGLRDFRLPWALLVGLVAWMAIQLVPLPPGIWQALPGRDPVVELEAALGVGGIWRPISMVPTRTLNALASLVVPVVALLLAAAFGTSRKTLFFGLIAIGAANAVIGLLQVMGGDALYFYDITNRGYPVGFFANRNHAAMLSSVTILIISYTMTIANFAIVREWQRFVLGALIVLLLVAVLMSGSRAGLLTLAMALATSGILFWNDFRSERVSRPYRQPGADWKRRMPVIFLIGALGLMIAATVFAVFDQIPALDRIVEDNAFDDMRWKILPILREMVATYGTVGSGFGSFEEVYHISEPTELLAATYVNQAHNDWLQLVIEGGIPAALLALALLVWFGRTVMIVWRAEHGAQRALVWMVMLAIVLLGSFVDYPLRTALFQLVAIWLIAALCREAAVERRQV